MRATIKTKAGTADIAADEPGVVPGVVRVKLGLFTLFLSPYEAAQIGLKAVEASKAAADALVREGAGK